MSMREQHEWLPNKARQQRKSTLLTAASRVGTRRIDKLMSHRLIALVSLVNACKSYSCNAIGHLRRARARGGCGSLLQLTNGYREPNTGQLEGLAARYEGILHCRQCHAATCGNAAAYSLVRSLWTDQRSDAADRGGRSRFRDAITPQTCKRCRPPGAA